MMFLKAHARLPLITAVLKNFPQASYRVVVAKWVRGDLEVLQAVVLRGQAQAGPAA
jgi:hypothetical protein